MGQDATVEHARRRRGSCLLAVREEKQELVVPRAVQLGVFPAVGVLANAPEANRRVGHDVVSTPPRPLAKGIVLGQIPVPVGTVLITLRRDVVPHAGTDAQRWSA